MVWYTISLCRILWQSYFNWTTRPCLCIGSFRRRLQTPTLACRRVAWPFRVLVVCKYRREWPLAFRNECANNWKWDPFVQSRDWSPPSSGLTFSEMYLLTVPTKSKSPQNSTVPQRVVWNIQSTSNINVQQHVARTLLSIAEYLLAHCAFARLAKICMCVNNLMTSPAPVSSCVIKCAR